MHAAAQDLGKHGRICSPIKGSPSLASPHSYPQEPSRAGKPHAAAGSEDEDEAGGSNPECSHAACSAKVISKAAGTRLVALSIFI